MRIFGKLIASTHPTRRSRAVPATHVIGYEDRVRKEVMEIHNIQSI